MGFGLLVCSLSSKCLLSSLLQQFPIVVLPLFWQAAIFDIFPATSQQLLWIPTAFLFWGIYFWGFIYFLFLTLPSWTGFTDKSSLALGSTFGALQSFLQATGKLTNPCATKQGKFRSANDFALHLPCLPFWVHSAKVLSWDLFYRWSDTYFFFFPSKHVFRSIFSTCSFFPYKFQWLSCISFMADNFELYESS